MTILDHPQRSGPWYAARRGLPTCSRFDQILTAVTGKPSAAQSKLIDELLAESLCPVEEALPEYVSPEMEQGMRLEAEARCAYEFEFANSQPIREVGFILSECGRFGGSPDALVGDDGGVELKAPSPSTHLGYIRGGTLPNEYRVSVHGYMVVTGRKWWDFASYARHLPRFCIRVQRDDFTAKLAAELEAFCAKYNAARVAFNLAPLGKTP